MRQSIAFGYQALVFYKAKENEKMKENLKKMGETFVDIKNC